MCVCLYTVHKVSKYFDELFCIWVCIVCCFIGNATISQWIKRVQTYKDGEIGRKERKVSHSLSWKHITKNTVIESSDCTREYRISNEIKIAFFFTVAYNISIINEWATIYKTYTRILNDIHVSQLKLTHFHFIISHRFGGGAAADGTFIVLFFLSFGKR